MKKTDTHAAFPSLLEKWITETGQDRSRLREARFSTFFDWLSDNYPVYTRFKSTMTARYDLELWFDEATGQLSSR